MIYFYLQLAEIMLKAYANTQKQLIVENKQTPFISIKLTHITLELCNN